MQSFRSRNSKNFPLMANKLVSFVKKLFEEWRQKTPKEKWQSIYDLAGNLSETIGVTVYTSMENYWFSYFSEVMSSIYFLTSFYTLWYYFEKQEYLRGLQGTCAVGIVVACLTVQLQTLGPMKYKMNNLLQFGGRYVYMETDETPKMRVVRQKMINNLIRNTAFIVSLIMFAFGLFGLSSGYLIVFKGERVTFLGTEIPFVDKESEFGFWLNIFIQTIIAGLGIFACIAIEIGAGLINNAIAAIPQLIHVDSEELTTELTSNGTTVRAKARLRNIYMKIQDYENIVSDSIDIYYMRLFICPFLFTYSISFSLFGQLLLGYPSGYGIASANYLLLIICCYLGEIMEQSKEKISAELYMMSWYMLPADSQRQVCCAIHMIQNGGSLTIGPFSKLNLEAAADLTKSIYRVTMLLYKLFA